MLDDEDLLPGSQVKALALFQFSLEGIYHGSGLPGVRLDIKKADEDDGGYQHQAAEAPDPGQSLVLSPHVEPLASSEEIERGFELKFFHELVFFFCASLLLLLLLWVRRVKVITWNFL